ncbi:hypothetical protein PZH44_13775, partial [Alistipes putredinis]|nr:hypothetical protein [Alistipes putredinis]
KILYQLSDCQTMLPTLSRQSVTICIRQFHCDFSLSDCLNFFLLVLAPTHALPLFLLDIIPTNFRISAVISRGIEGGLATLTSSKWLAI